MDNSWGGMKCLQHRLDFCRVNLPQISHIQHNQLHFHLVLQSHDVHTFPDRKPLTPVVIICKKNNKFYSKVFTDTNQLQSIPKVFSIITYQFYFREVINLQNPTTLHRNYFGLILSISEAREDFESLE